MNNLIFNLLNITNPSTNDNIILYSIVGLVALVGMIVIFIVLGKKKDKSEDKEAEKKDNN